jgi:hypothetical protein
MKLATALRDSISVPSYVGVLEAFCLVWSAAATLHQLPLSCSRSGELRPTWRTNTAGGSSTLPL